LAGRSTGYSVLGERILSEGLDVVVLDVLTARSTAFLRASLEGVSIVQLLPSLEEIRHRFVEREAQEGFKRLTTAEMEALYRQQAQFSAYDLRIDNSEMSPSAVAETLLPYLGYR
jgi:hypothetical protein